MKISIPKHRAFTIGQQKTFERLAKYVMTHYPKDTQLHKAVIGSFKSTKAVSVKLAKGQSKAVKRTTTRRRRSPIKRRAVRRTRKTGTRRRVARKAPKRRKVARRVVRKRTARRSPRRVRRVVRRRRSA
jgi:hypothetical protein